MTTNIDADLISAVRQGRAVLFLGAGASKGAIHQYGMQIPDGAMLGKLLADQYLTASHSDLDLKTIYDLACSARSVREVQKFVHGILVDFQPTAWHEKLPEFAWAGLATTNYDLLVERAYAKQKGIKIVPYAHDGAVDLNSLANNDLLYLKLHGCVTEYDNVQPPLITSTEQLINFEAGRRNLFKQFLEWGQNHPIAFVGYKLNDPNLRALAHQLIKEGDNRPRHFIVRPDIDSYEEKYWLDRRFTPVKATFGELIEGLDAAIPKNTRTLSTIIAGTRHSSFTKYISRSGATESRELLGALDTVIEHVSNETVIPNGKPERFYAGLNQGWFPIANDLDAHRNVTDRILTSWILPSEVGRRASFYLLKGHAGSGKTVALKRVAWETARKYDKLVFLLRPGERINEEVLAEIFLLTDRTVYFFVDDAGDHYHEIKHLMSRAVVKKWPLIVIGAERVNEWNVQDVEADALTDDQLTLGYLSEPEISELVTLLELHKSLGNLSSLSFEDRVKSFKEFAGRQLLVALHEATHGVSFEDILENEYNNISPAEARVLYLDICALHRFGPPVRAGLISRIHGISFTEFHQRFLRPLETVVVVNGRGTVADYSYQARHNYIAETVFERALKTAEEKFDVIMRILSKLNPDYSYDKIVFSHLIRARTLSEIMPRRELGMAIYEAAEQSAGRTALVLHQRALYEMRIAGQRIGLDRAETLIKEAIDLEPNNNSLKHSLAEVALRRSEIAQSPLEAASERQEAAMIAKRLTRNAKTPYAYHTLAKIMIADLDAAIKADKDNPSELSSEAVNRAIQAAEAAIREGLNRFPNEEFLLTSEAELSKLLSNADRALIALQKALKSNPKSELISSRLALIHTARKDYDQAIQVLKTALNYSPGDPRLNFQYAQAIIAQRPTADSDEAETLLFHFKRAYQAGSNIQSQYWYARQLFLAGKNSESKEIFGQLSRVAPPYLKRDDIGIVMGPLSQPRIYYGQVAYVTEGFGLVDNTAPFARIFFRRVGGLFETNDVKQNERVGYNIAFNAKGPIAINMFVA